DGHVGAALARSQHQRHVADREARLERKSLDDQPILDAESSEPSGRRARQRPTDEPVPLLLDLVLGRRLAGAELGEIGIRRLDEIDLFCSEYLADEGAGAEN